MVSCALKGTLSPLTQSMRGSLSNGTQSVTGRVTGKGTVGDHDTLRNRGLDNQHPLTAITDLLPELGLRPKEALSNAEILEILQS